MAPTHGPDGMPLSEDLVAGADQHPRHRAYAEHCRQQYLRGELEGFEVLAPEAVFLEDCAALAASEEMEYLVQAADTGVIPKDSVGIAYRFSKAVEDMDMSATAIWGIVVTGTDEGDGWLRVGNRYLPMAVNGVEVLTPKDATEFIVDNRQLQSNAAGLAYRFSRNLEDKDLREGPVGGPPFGTIVLGVDMGDGWVKVRNRFLPMEIDGARVLLPTNEEFSACPAGVQGVDLKSDEGIEKTGPDSGLVGDRETLQKELEELYRELHRRMGGGPGSGGLAEPTPLPPLSPGILDFPLSQHGGAPVKQWSGALAAAGSPYGLRRPSQDDVVSFAGDPPPIPRPAPVPPSMTVKL